MLMTTPYTARATVVGIERYCIPREVIAECDQCKDQYLGGDVWNSTAKNEDLLASDGWSIHGDNVHVCPNCLRRG